MGRTPAAAWVAAIATLIGALSTISIASESALPAPFWLASSVGYLGSITIACALFVPERGLARGAFAAAHILLMVWGFLRLYSVLADPSASSNMPSAILGSMLGSSVVSLPVAGCALWWAIAPRPGATLATRIVFAAAAALRASGMLIGAFTPFGGATAWSYTLYFIGFVPSLALVVALPSLPRDAPTSL